MAKTPDFKKMTKQQIIDYIAEGNTIVTAKVETEFNPHKDAEKKAQVEIVAKATSSKPTDVVTMAQELLAKFSGVKEEFENLNAAIAIKKDELESLYGIESGLLDLATVIEGTKLAETERDELLSEIDTKITAKQEELKNLEFEIRKQLNEKNVALNKEYAGLLDDAKYQHKISLRNLSDELEGKKKIAFAEIDAKREEFNKFDATLTARAEEISDMEATIDNFDGYLNQKVNSAVAAAVETANKDWEHKFALKEADYKNQLLELQGQNKSMGMRIGDLTKQNDDLNAKLTTAYDKITEMAGKVAEASGRVVYKDTNSGK